MQAQLEEARSLLSEMSREGSTVQTELQTSKEATSRLQLKLISLEVSKNEETALREELEEKYSRMNEEHKLQLEDALCKAAEEKAYIEALEGQQVLSINEIEKCQEEMEKLVLKLKRRDERERLLKKKVNHLEWELSKEKELREIEREVEDGETLDEEEREALELKLENAKRELEKARELNNKIQGEQDLQSLKQKVMDYSRSEAETETALVITSMQEELAALEEELSTANQNAVAAHEKVAQLTEELENVKAILDSAQEEISSANKKHEKIVEEKDIEIESLQRSWETATNKLTEYLEIGDQALFEAVLEMEELMELSRPQRRLSHTTKTQAFDFLHKQLQDAQEMARDAEHKVRALSQTSLQIAFLQEGGKDATGNSRPQFLDDVIRFQQEAQTQEVTRVKLVAEQDFAESRMAECEAMLLAMQGNLAHAEMKLHQAEDRSLELAKAQQALAVAKEEWNCEKATLLNELSEREQQCTSVQQALTSLQFQLQDAESREEGLTMELEQLRLAKEDWGAQEEKLEEELEELRFGMKQPKLEVIMESDDEVADDHIGVVTEKEKELQFARSALAKLNLELLKVAEAHGCLRLESTRRIAEKVVMKTECASLEIELDEATSIAKQAQEKIDSLKLILDDFSKAEARWKSEKLVLEGQVQDLNAQLVDREIEYVSLKGEYERLDAALSSLRLEEVKTSCELAELQQNLKISESKWQINVERLEKTIEANNLDIAETKVALGSAEEKVRLLTEANSTGRRDWDAERVRLRTKNESMQRDIARLEDNASLSSIDGNTFLALGNGRCKTQDDLVEEVKCNSQEIERLHEMIRERDDTILSLRMEFETAISKHRVAEIQVDKILREKDKELYESTKEMEAYELEVRKLMDIVSETEDRLVKSEADWRTEKLSLLAGRDNAVLDANLRKSEAAALSRNFQNNQATLHEAELMVDALVQAKDSAKSDAEGWKLENERLCLAQTAIADLQCSVSCRDADLVALQFKLNECHSHTADIERNHQDTVTRLQAELDQKVKELDMVKEEITALNKAAATVEQENRVMKDQIAELRSKAAALEVDLEAKVSEVRALEEELVLAEKKRDLMLQEAVENMKEVETQREMLRLDLASLRRELELAKELVKERDSIAADACQVQYRDEYQLPSIPVFWLLASHLHSSGVSIMLEYKVFLTLLYDYWFSLAGGRNA